MPLIGESLLEKTGVERIKLLIVEDEPYICASLQSYFGKRNFIVSVTGSGFEALSMIAVSRPDIVLLDLGLNDLSGVEVLKRLRGYDRETKVVVITGQMYMEEEIAKIFGLGISDYKTKPLILQEVETLVFETVGKNRLTSYEGMQSRKKADVGSSGVVHTLANLLGVIRNQCENFTLNVEDNIYKDKSPGELVHMSTEIMKDVQKTVDRAMEVVEKIKEDAPGR